MKIAVFGATGMLGRAVSNELSSFGFECVTIGRSNCDVDFDVFKNRLEDVDFDGFTYAVNCIGLITHLIDENQPSSTAQAIRLNSLFPHELAALAEQKNLKVIQIATDCVFSGVGGGYVESSIHDANDIYGKTKSLGEVKSPFLMNLRTSIIGLEERGFQSLLEWVIRQPRDSEIQGFTDRMWNGLTTVAFARIVRGIIDKNIFSPGLQHVVPADLVSKAELVRLIADEFQRQDIRIRNIGSGSARNLTLATNNPEKNRDLWVSAGYHEIPNVQGMIRGLNA